MKEFSVISKQHPKSRAIADARKKMNTLLEVAGEPPLLDGEGTFRPYKGRTGPFIGGDGPGWEFTVLRDDPTIGAIYSL
jgi:hypothetical protein